MHDILVAMSKSSPFWFDDQFLHQIMDEIFMFMPVNFWLQVKNLIK